MMRPLLITSSRDHRWLLFCKEHKAFSAALPPCVAPISGDEKSVRATCSSVPVVMVMGGEKVPKKKSN